MNTRFFLAWALAVLSAFLHAGCASRPKGAPAPAGPMVYLPWHEGVADASGNRFPVRVRNVTIRDGAACIDSKGSWVALPHQPLERGSFAIAMWVKLEGDAPSRGLAEMKSQVKRPARTCTWLSAESTCSSDFTRPI